MYQKPNVSDFVRSIKEGVDPADGQLPMGPPTPTGADPRAALLVVFRAAVIRILEDGEKDIPGQVPLTPPEKIRAVIKLANEYQKFIDGTPSNTEESRRLRGMDWRVDFVESIKGTRS